MIGRYQWDVGMTNDDFFKYKPIIIRVMSRLRCKNTRLVSRQDLFQVGCIALIKALQSPDYDPAKGNMEGYVYASVRNYLLNYFRFLRRRCNFRKEVQYLCG